MADKLVKKDFTLNISKDGNSLIIKYKGFTVFNLNISNIFKISFEKDNAVSKDNDKKASSFYLIYKKLQLRDAKENNYELSGLFKLNKMPKAIKQDIKKIIKNLQDSELEDKYDSHKILYKRYISTINNAYKSNRNELYDGREEKDCFVPISVLKRDGAVSLFISEKSKIISKKKNKKKDLLADQFDKVFDKYKYRSNITKKEKELLKNLSIKAFGEVVDELKILLKR